MEADCDTFFEKPLGKQIIWKPPATQGFASPWDPERFVELCRHLYSKRQMEEYSHECARRYKDKHRQ